MPETTRTKSNKRENSPVNQARVPRGQVQERILSDIRHGLMAGAFVPGQLMSLRYLAEVFGVSPMPVREALSQLVAANVLEQLPSRSVRVPTLTEKKLRELAEVRIAVEGLAVKFACNNSTPKLVKKLESTNQKLTKAIEQRNIAECLSLNQQFHFTLYDAAQSDILSPVIESLWLQFGPTLYYSVISSNFPWDASAHIEIIDALSNSDVGRAQRAIARDIRVTLKSLLKESLFDEINGVYGTQIASMKFNLSKTR